MDELAAMLQQKEYHLPTQTPRLEEAVELAAIGRDIVQSFNVSGDNVSLELNLACLGVTCKPLLGKNNGVEDFLLTYMGKSVKASDILDGKAMDSLYQRWEHLTGQEAEYKVRQKLERQEAERKLKLTLESERHSRGIRMRF